MAISKKIVVQAYGATAEFHRVVNFSADVNANTCTATVLQYVDQKAFAEGKMPLGSEHIVISGTPGENDPAIAWIEGELIKPAPTDGTEGMQAPNRFIYADGVRI